MVLMGSRFNERRRDDDLQSVSGLPDLRTVPERRTAPDLPDIQNNVRDSGTTFFFGRSSSGENVDEKSAMQIATVYACVRLLADSVAQIPLHLYKWDGEDRSVKAREHPLYKILHRQANP
ncbi:MAG: phage portal protein, partial [Synergistaceae bacterium]|nr:phage portal protein [Synergistaceae bacterium]